MQQGATIYETNSSPTHFYCAENRFTSEPPPQFRYRLCFFGDDAL